jgi:hypothetical protein
MKPKKNEPKIPSDSSLQKGCKPRKKSPPLSAQEATEVMTEWLSKVNPRPVGGRMLLKNEIGLKWTNPSWLQVEEVIRELDPGHFNSHACLSIPGNNYIQALRGFNGYHLEWRITNPSGNYVHYRACYPSGSRKPIELKKHDCMNDGQHRDLLNLEDVVAAFRSFHQREGLPGFLKWRDLKI